MCGIWGFASKASGWKADVLRRTVQKLFLLSESRGKEAAGIAIYSGETVSVFKRRKPASAMLRMPDYEKYLTEYLPSGDSPFAIIGHSRLATNGSSVNPENNQPVLREEAVTVHNGILTNCDKLWERYPQFQRSSDVDTEILPQLISRHLSDGLDPCHAIIETYREIEGMASTCNILAAYGCLTAGTNSGALYACISKDGNSVLLASEYRILMRLLQSLSALRGVFSAQDIQKIPPQQGVILSLYTAAPTAHFSFADAEKVIEAVPARPYKQVIDQEEAESQDPGIGPKFFAEKYKKYEIDTEPIRRMRRCTRCLLPETMPFIQFDGEGVCNYCHSYQPQVILGKEKLLDWAEHTRKQYNGCCDSIVSFSGGRDSSYGLHYFVKELGLKPVAYSYDWGMVTDLARRNQSRMCSKLGVELIVISADIQKKRANIRKNIAAWLKKPDLGLVPLFMAGDKQFYYYANQIRKQLGVSELLLASNPYEATLFKSGFCGVRPDVLCGKDKNVTIEQLPFLDVFKLAGYYLNRYLRNPSYFNASILDTAAASASYYMIPHNYFRLYDYIRWEENEVNDVLLNRYGWELAPDTESTWRIGDGTAPFYNYIYYLAAGFTENDCLRSNQIREGMLTREEGLELIYRDNQPRFESLKWYFDAIGMDMFEVLDVVNRMTRLYQK